MPRQNLQHMHMSTTRAVVNCREVWQLGSCSASPPGAEYSAHSCRLKQELLHPVGTSDATQAQCDLTYPTCGSAHWVAAMPAHAIGDSMSPWPGEPRLRAWPLQTARQQRPCTSCGHCVLTTPACAAAGAAAPPTWPTKGNTPQMPCVGRHICPLDGQRCICQVCILCA